MTDSSPDATADAQWEFGDHLAQIPHSKALGMHYLNHTDDYCEIGIRYSPHLVGDPDTGVIHGGAITALLDNAAGMVARPPNMPRETASIATLDLRIDYMESAQPHKDVIARANCFKRTKNVAFVRAIAYQDNVDEPIATCTATFMLGTRNAPRPATGTSE